MEQIIQCSRAGTAHQFCPRESRIALGSSLIIRYCKTFVKDDYEEATLILDDLTTSSSPGDPFVVFAQQMVTVLAILRSTAHCSPEYSEEAAYCVRGVTASSSVEESAIGFDPEGVARKRFRDFGLIRDTSQTFSFFPLTKTNMGKYFGVSLGGWEGKFYEGSDLPKLERIEEILSCYDKGLYDRFLFIFLVY